MAEVFGTVDLREAFLRRIVYAFPVHTRSLVVDACLGKLRSGDLVVKVDEEEAPMLLHLVVAAAPNHRKGPSSCLRLPAVDLFFYLLLLLALPTTMSPVHLHV
jgi:hypothetical protein